MRSPQAGCACQRRLRAQPEELASEEAPSPYVPFPPVSSRHRTEGRPETRIGGSGSGKACWLVGRALPTHLAGSTSSIGSGFTSPSACPSSPVTSRA